MCDTKSYELAEYFLADEDDMTEEDRKELAQRIQEAVEDFLKSRQK
jgi:hypothetical protein